jgi:hypothetical protein
VAASTVTTELVSGQAACTTHNCWLVNNAQTVASETMTAVEAATSGPGYTTPTGNWTCPFDASSADAIETYAQSPIGLHVQVKANCFNGTTHQVCLQAVMEYWATENADGSLGPIASKGPRIENMQMYKPGCATKVNYDLTFLRNGVRQRQYLNITQTGFTGNVATRPDGQFDWTSDDPQIWVNQDCSLVRKTGLIPPFPNSVCGLNSTYAGGLGYQPTTRISGISAGVFTVSTTANIMYSGSNIPTGVQVSGTKLPGGMNANAVYWSCHAGQTSLQLYDTLADALACGTTGQIVPTSAGSNVIVKLAAAPMHPALYDVNGGDPGSRPDISITAEWGAAYLGYNSQDGQRMARVSALAFWGIPEWNIDNATGLPPCLLDAPGTTGSGDAGCPAGLPAKPGSYWEPNGGYVSTDMNGGKLAGGYGFWGPEGSHFIANVPWTVWLLEGGPGMRDLLLQDGNRGIANRAYLPNRIVHVPGGPTYYAEMLTWDNGSTRGGAWSMRDGSMAAFAAPQGSPMDTYFHNVLESNVLAQNAYWTFKGANVTNLGLIFTDDGFARMTLEQGYGANFMQTYIVGSVNFAAALDGPDVPGLSAMADKTLSWLTGLYNTNCGYFATSYDLGWSRSDLNAAPPGTYIQNITQMGYDNTRSVYTFTAGSPTITTVSTTGKAPPTPWAVKVGDRVWWNNWNNVSLPPPLVDNQVYYIVAVNPDNSFAVSATARGTPITPTASATHLYGIMIPAAQSCPSTGTYGDAGANNGNPDSYTTEKMFSLALGAVRGNVAAASAWNAANVRFLAGRGSFNSEMMFSSQPTP